jgi:hypothetical protein
MPKLRIKSITRVQQVGDLWCVQVEDPGTFEFVCQFAVFGDVISAPKVAQEWIDKLCAVESVA